MTFMDEWRAGIATRDDLSTYMSNWWKRTDGLTLRDYLGMTPEEWTTFVTYDVLPNRKEK